MALNFISIFCIINFLYGSECDRKVAESIRLSLLQRVEYDAVSLESKPRLMSFPPEGALGMPLLLSNEGGAIYFLARLVFADGIKEIEVGVDKKPVPLSMYVIEALPVHFGGALIFKKNE